MQLKVWGLVVLRVDWRNNLAAAPTSTVDPDLAVGVMIGIEHALEEVVTRTVHAHGPRVEENRDNGVSSLLDLSLDDRSTPQW